MADTNANYRVLNDGTTPVPTPGTAVQLNTGTSLSCRMVTVHAPSENVGRVTVGASTVKATAGVSRGVSLAPGESRDIWVADVNLLWVDAQNANDYVSWIAYKSTD